MTSLLRHALPALLGLLPLAAVALSSDRQQPMYVEADSAEINDQTGISIYRGHVRITQGTLEINARQVTLYSRDGEVRKAVAVGKPATYRQLPDGKTEPVRAEALRMEYLPPEDRLLLFEQARVWQNGDDFRSERIVYDIGLDQVNAGAGNGDRVRITIQPRAKP
ncbi:lipopolysaccharide transport periplasmic protein LptA [Thiohalobacter sp. IOR34]|uniref:lipopolysaccharide transport periplasmic protein LptA n=1 Tax=Thiohalobacter sp. IOR34 TaxID=3057176 RepID=UPI0025B13A19|nr:lipopolysaccharide transport periplasmic protein LptA [Thiohalobacter sp. IOR34]WJW74858.1 lipopolysaccharide transport periplasmic protein LptA [Thiohalobacter sp. IOR34]